MKQLVKNKIGLVFIILQLLITLGLVGYVLYIDILPDMYLLILVIVLVFLLLYTFFSQMSQKFRILGRVLSGLFCIVMCVGAAYLWMGYSTIDKVADSNIKIDEMSAIVLADDPAESIDDVSEYSFGIIGNVGREYTDSMIESIEKDLGKEIVTVEYTDSLSLVDALYAQEVQVIIFNEAYRGMVAESHKDFDTETKILGNHEIETVIDISEEEEEQEVADEKEEEKKEKKANTFIVYCSGIDTYGSISKTSRSDVNVIAVVNMDTSQILLVNTPRDTYIPLSISNGNRDKLTHAGIYGVDVSIATLEQLYDIDVDYYLRVNFTGIINIVNALGGVKVYSDKTFRSDWGPSFTQGYNYVNGEQALAFCRERHHFSDGDHQRGRNHQHMIEAILEKATSPAILKNFSGFMKSIEGAFETNMKTKKITSLVKFQMKEKPKWKIESIAITGKGGKNFTYSIPNKKSYVLYPDEQSIQDAKDEIQRVLDGKKFKKSKEKKDGDENN